MLIKNIIIIYLSSSAKTSGMYSRTHLRNFSPDLATIAEINARSTEAFQFGTREVRLILGAVMSISFASWPIFVRIGSDSYSFFAGDTSS